ncbi:MAG: hypothetical protein LRY59_00595 [Bacteroides graminisolvens]|nr:hypothetical protein [Bacteroides graminisolvens]
MQLLSNIDSKLYMFADQDDLWLPDKIQLSVEAYNLEYSKNPKKGIIVHTDISLVDSNLNVISNSRWNDIHLNPDNFKSYNCISICNYVQGSTMLFDNNIKLMSFPLQDYAIMHDWWIATRCLKNQGKIITIHQPTMLYRQHSSNVFGMKSNSNLTISAKFKRSWDSIIENIKFYKILQKDNYGSFFKFLWYKSYILMNRFVQS